MENKKPYLASNIDYLIKMSGLSITKLAQEFNLSDGLLNKLKAGTSKNTTVKSLISISHYFNITIDDLVFTNIAKIGILPKIKNINYIPLFSLENISHPNNDLILITQDLPPGTFAVKISNKSNLFQNVFQSGSIVFANRNIKPKSRDYIIVLNLTSWLYSLKQLIIEDSSSYLKSTIMNETIKFFNKTEYAYYATVIGYQESKQFF